MPDSDTMAVPVTIEGRPAKLMIGIADGSQLWNAQAEKLGLAVREGGRMMDGGGRFSEDVARVGSLSLGSMETGNFVTQIGADPDFAGSDGVLGTDMMMRYDIDLDFAHHRMNYFTPEQCQGAGVYWAPGKVTSVKMEAYADVVFVPVNLDGHMIVAALDTTADRTFLNPRIADKLFGLRPESLTPGSVRDSGAVMKAGMRRFSSLTLRGIDLRQSRDRDSVRHAEPEHARISRQQDRPRHISFVRIPARHDHRHGCAETDPPLCLVPGSESLCLTGRRRPSFDGDAGKDQLVQCLAAWI